MTDNGTYPETDQEGWAPALLVYEGKRLTVNGQLRGLWRDTERDDTGLFTRTNYQVGGLYRVPVKRVDGEWTSAQFGEVVREGQLPESQCAMLMAEQRAAETALEEKRAAKRLAADDALSEHLTALAIAYRRATWPQKAGLLAYFISRITK